MDDDVEIEIREVDADFADKNEDQIMEEGELSDENEPATDKFSRQKRSLADRLGPKLNTRRNYADDVEERSRSRLPDLVRELEPGIELNRATVEKMEARAKRFQLGSNAGINFDEIEKLYTNLGIPENQRLKENEELREFRHEAVHITGFENKVQNEDLFKYFGEYNPVNYEWCDGKSANIVWALEASAPKALANLSRPISETDNDDAMSDSVLSPEEQKEKLIAQFEGTTNDTPIDVKELGITVPLQGGPWRIGKPSNLENWKNSTAIFMRLARKN